MIFCILPTLIDIPNGNYPGVFSGYKIKFSVGNENHILATELGVRGTVAVVLKVENKLITVYLYD